MSPPLLNPFTDGRLKPRITLGDNVGHDIDSQPAKVSPERRGKGMSVCGGPAGVRNRERRPVSEVNSPIACPVTVEQRLRSATATATNRQSQRTLQPGRGRRSRPGIGFQGAPDR